MGVENAQQREPDHRSPQGPVGEALSARRERPEVRHAWATRLSAQVEAPMAALGLLFLLVVLAQDLAETDALARFFAVLGWALWAVFSGEFLLRLYVAPRRRAFLARNWWQVVFLLLPFLRFLRLVQALRVVRAGRVLSSTVRSSRSAGMLARSRMAWLALVSAIVVLAASQLLFVFDVYTSYGEALHASALAALTGEPLRQQSRLADGMEILLAAYSVVVVASLAAAVGAYFLREAPGSASAR